MKVYKLTDEKMQTYNGFTWELNKTFITSGKGKLCGKGFLHSYEHPLLAVLHNPIHSWFNLETMRLFEAEASGTILKDNQLKMGSSQLTLIKEIPMPIISIEQKIKYAIFCAKEVCQDQGWNTWADNWLSGKDRSQTTAKAAEAAARSTVEAMRAAGAAARTAAIAARSAYWSAADAARSVAEAVARSAVEAAVRAAGAARSASDINLIAIAERSIQ